MRLLLDEMHSPAVARALYERGHDVFAVVSDPLLRGMADAELLSYGAETSSAILTENIRDFAKLASEWTARDTPHARLIFTNPTRFNRNTSAYPAKLITALTHFLEDPPVNNNRTWWLQPPP